MSPLESSFLELQTRLSDYSPVWQESLFHHERPAWCDEHPALTSSLLSLDDASAQALTDDPDSALDWLVPYLPTLPDLRRLSSLVALPKRTLAKTERRLDWAIPGRKREQVEAFVASMAASGKPVLEWCAGKGHLGRLATAQDNVPVKSLELELALCHKGASLAERAGLDQHFVCADALCVSSKSHVRGHSVLALHACGELHRSLIRSASHDGAHAYRIAPCCYHKWTGEQYQPLSRLAALPLGQSALRLAVTETVTAPGSDRRRLVRDQVHKLGFVALRNALEGSVARTFKPVPSHWLQENFEAYCHKLAARESVRLPDRVDWAYWLLRGEQRRHQMIRLEIVRQAFRRALEVWLVFDMGLALEEAGFMVRIGTFCDRRLTPRNIMLMADPVG